MIILDTNVLSELMKANPIAINWLNNFDKKSIWLTSITIMEIQYGINLLPTGKKKNQLQKAFDSTLIEDFRNHIFEFDINAAFTTAKIAAKFKLSGQNVEIRDLQISGIALAKRGYIATRNEKDFHGTGVEIINPWKV